MVSGACGDQRAGNKLLSIQRRIASILNVPSDYHVLLFDLNDVEELNVFGCLKLEGVEDSSRCGFFDSGSRSFAAMRLASSYFEVEIIGSSSASNDSIVPKADWAASNIDFLHLTSMNEREGNSINRLSGLRKPVLLDMSADLFLTGVLIEDFSMVYAFGNNQIIPDQLCVVLIQNSFLATAGHRLLAHAALLGGCERFPAGVFQSLFLFDHHLRELEKSGE